MSKNLSKGKDKGYGVKKYDAEGKINKEWKKIHYGTKMPKGSIESGNDFPTSLNQIL